MLERGEQLALLAQTIEMTESAQTQSKKQMKEDLDALLSKQRVLAKTIRQREEDRDVDVEIVFDYDLLQVREVRTDTGEMLASRTMTDAERQRELPGMVAAARH